MFTLSVLLEKAGTPPSSTETGLGRRSYSYRTPPGHSGKQPGDTR